MNFWSRSCCKIFSSTCLIECSLIKSWLEYLEKVREQVLKFFRTLGGEFTNKFLIKHFMITGWNFLIVSFEIDSKIGKKFTINYNNRNNYMKLRNFLLVLLELNPWGYIVEKFIKGCIQKAGNFLNFWSRPRCIIFFSTCLYGCSLIKILLGNLKKKRGNRYSNFFES